MPMKKEANKQPQKTVETPMLTKDLKGKDLQKAILCDVNNLPPMPQVIQKARKIINNPKSSLKELSDLIEKDQALAMKVLRLSNSAFYSRPQTASSIQDAAVILGLNVLGEMLTVACASRFLGQALKGYRLGSGAMWRHSLSVAIGARMVANRKNPELAEEAFSAGLIHDTGKLILDKYILERWDAFEAFLKDNNETFLDAEKEILGFDHAELAAFVCERWDFPKSMWSAIKYHHRPSRFRGNALAYILHVSDQLAIWSGMDNDGIPLEACHASFRVLGIGIEDVEPMMDQITVTVEDMLQSVKA